MPKYLCALSVQVPECLPSECPSFQFSSECSSALWMTKCLIALLEPSECSKELNPLSANPTKWSKHSNNSSVFAGIDINTERKHRYTKRLQHENSSTWKACITRKVHHGKKETQKDCNMNIHAFFISNTFINNYSLNIRYLKTIHFLHPRYHPKIANRRYSKKCTKKQVRLF